LGFLDVGEECVRNYYTEEGSEYYTYYDEEYPCQYGYDDAAQSACSEACFVDPDPGYES
jgi:hypothetical protein